nr:predicted GPI-anchored protein 58 [Aegilops tauschii subsp. strangulata]
MPPGNATGPAAVASSAPGARASAPHAMRPLGSALLKRSRDYAVVDQSTLSAKKKREGAAASSKAQQPSLAAPPPAQKGGEAAPTSPDRSSSRGPANHPQEKATSSAKPALEAPISSLPADVAEAQKLPVSLPAVISSQAFARTHR